MSRSKDGPKIFDISKLQTPEEARNLMINARRQGREDIYQAAFARMCELVVQSEDAPDPFVKDFKMMLAAYEQLLAEKNGRRTAAVRTRQKISRDGELATAKDWARKRQPTMGFDLLTEAGLWQLTGEYLIIKHSSLFSFSDVQAAKIRLKEKGINIE